MRVTFLETYDASGAKETQSVQPKPSAFNDLGPAGRKIPLDPDALLQALRMLEDQSGSPLQAREDQAGDVVAASPSQPTRKMEEDRARKTAWARRLWSACQPLEGSLAESYLRSCGITVKPGPALAFHPALRHPATARLHPALVAAVTDGNGRISGIHRTFLSSNGAGKADVFPAKMMAGVCIGRCVRFGRAGETSGHVLAIGEGIETSLSVRQATGLRSGQPSASQA